MGLQGAANEKGKAFDWEVTKRLGGYVFSYRRELYTALAGMALTVFATVIGLLSFGHAQAQTPGLLAQAGAAEPAAPPRP